MNIGKVILALLDESCMTELGYHVNKPTKTAKKWKKSIEQFNQ